MTWWCIDRKSSAWPNSREKMQAALSDTSRTCALSRGRKHAARHRSQIARSLQWPLSNLGGFNLGNLFKPQEKENLRPAVVDEILELVQDSNRGLDSTPAEKKQIMELVDQLQEEMQGVETTANPELLSATWRLVWTTEKETQFIVKNANFFKTEAGDIFQVIDVPAGRLQNVITFPPSGAFVVNSSLKVGGPKRLIFKFNSAEVQKADGNIRIPPFGEGWFDNIYVDNEVRIAKDIRKDVLIVVRDGPPQNF